MAVTNVDNEFSVTQHVADTLIAGTNAEVHIGTNAEVHIGTFVGNSAYSGIWVSNPDASIVPTISNFAFLKGNGNTILNTPTGENFSFRVGNLNKALLWASGGISIGSTIAHHTTGIDSGTDNLLVEGTVLASNLSGTNTGDNATNTQYSGLVTFPGFGTLNGDYGYTEPTHAGVFEPVFSKNTAFNKNFGTSAGTVLEGDTFIPTDFDPAGTDNSDDNAINTLYSPLITNATHTGEVTGSGALTIASDVVDLDNLAVDLKGEVDLLATSVTNFNSGITFLKALTGAWSPTFSNPIVGKTIMVITTGNYTITWPTGVDSVADFTNYLGTNRNVHIITCASTSLPLYTGTCKTYTI